MYVCPTNYCYKNRLCMFILLLIANIYILPLFPLDIEDDLDLLLSNLLSYSTLSRDFQL
ncbi:hypothetical protein Peur_008082 [Populus x canadensis]